jgi:hypothetical protein
MKDGRQPSMAVKAHLEERASVIVRSSAERTEGLCLQLIRDQGVEPAQTVVIREAPFARAVRASYEAGIELGRDWTVCVDADMLLIQGSISRILDAAERQTERVFEIQGKILDKFFGGPRDGGIHAYRTSLLPLAIKSIPPSKNTVRPEFETLGSMTERGYFWRRIDALAGLHGFEQYYRDIFRTCFMHARKHQEFAGLFMSYWQEKRAADPDFQIALEGYARALRSTTSVGIDSQAIFYKEAFEELGVPEKEPLQPDSWSASQLTAFVEQWVVPASCRRYLPDDMMFQGPLASRLRRAWAQLRGKYGAFGAPRLAIYALGRILEEGGIRLRALAEPYERPRPHNE